MRCAARVVGWGVLAGERGEGVGGRGGGREGGARHARAPGSNRPSPPFPAPPSMPPPPCPPLPAPPWLGNSINSFGQNLNNLPKLQEDVTNASLYFIYLGGCQHMVARQQRTPPHNGRPPPTLPAPLRPRPAPPPPGAGAFVAAFLQLSLWTISGVRQVNRIRHRYLAAVLRQDVGYFDKEATSGEGSELCCCFALRGVGFVAGSPAWLAGWLLLAWARAPLCHPRPPARPALCPAPRSAPPAQAVCCRA